MSIKSADNLIIATEAEKLGRKIPDMPKEEPKEEIKSEPKEVKNEQPNDSADSDKSNEGNDEKAAVEQEKPVVDEKKSEEASESNDETDDYGNKVDKPKLYTQEEVNKMIRDRLSRGKLADQTPQQQQEIKDAAQNFQADPESSEGWEQQLETFIEKTITKVSQKSQQEDWQRKERELQDQFEDKFTRGMGRYGDFTDVVAGKPITNGMMMATRAMQDPAAFLYAACKQHPAEIERIAAIPDPYAQSLEIGHLEEKMKKAKVITKAPTPAKKITGDMSDDMPKRSVDQLIAEHAKSKIMNRR